MSRRKVWAHRALAVFFAALTIPAVLWWRESVLFVILLSLATQISTELGVAEAADDQTLKAQQNRIEAKLDALLEMRRSGRG
jgi:hypothetical protein